MLAAVVDREASHSIRRSASLLCNPEHCASFSRALGCEHVKVRGLDITTRFASFDDYWQPLLTEQGSAPNYFATRDEHTQNMIREWLRNSLTTDCEGAIELPARAWAVRGRR